MLVSTRFCCWTARAGSLLLAAVVVFTFSASAAATDFGGWPQYRGPRGDGIAGASTLSEGGLAEAWPEGGPVELWRRPSGSGFSSVVVVGGVAFTMEAQGAEESVIALDVATGEGRWRTVVGEPVESEFGRGPRSTPTVVGGKVYAVSSGSRLLCLEAATGKIVWDHDLTVYDAVPRFGYSPSPVVVQGLVVVAVGTKDLVDAARKKAEEEARKADASDQKASGEKASGEKASGEKASEGAQEGEDGPEIKIEPQIGAVAAFDAATGALRWRGGFPGPVGYSSPVVAELAGVRQLVFSKFNQVVGLSLDGTPLWSHETPPKGALPMPVVLPGDVVFVSASDDHFGGLAVRVRRDEKGTWSTEEVWAQRLMRNHFNTSVGVGGTLYGFDNTTFKALDAATGERRWAHRGFGKGSLLAAGDLLYVLGDDGTLALVHADPAGYRESGRVQAMTGKAWTAPSLASGILLLRDHDEMVAYDVRATALAGASGPAAAAGATATVPHASARLAAESAAKLGAEEILARHAAARGGTDRWRRIRSLEMSGTYRAFSEISRFTLQRSRGAAGAAFRLEYHLFGVPAIRASGSGGPWLQHAFVTTEPTAVDGVPELAAYHQQLQREAHFGPLLLDAEDEGLILEVAGVGEINGQPTVQLEVKFPSPEAEPITETWYLDPKTFLEVAVDSEVVDVSQGSRPFRQRAFYSDFREVEGVRIPFQVDLEFNARFEGMRVETVVVNGAVDESLYAAPPPPAEKTEGKPAEG